jgi:hypothetical protein
MNENQIEQKLDSSEEELNTWKTKNQPGLVQFIFTLVLILVSFTKTGALEIENIPTRIGVAIATILACALVAYILKRIFLPTRIKELEKTITDLEELRYRQFLFWE